MTVTEKKEPTVKEKEMYYAQRLAEMIRCRTVSQKDSFAPAEFMKLRAVIETLFET